MSVNPAYFTPHGFAFPVAPVVPSGFTLAGFSWPTPLCDYHELIRDAVKATLDDAGIGLTVHALDDVDDILHQAVPCVAVTCVGPEQERSDWSTNASDGLGYSVVVALLTGGGSSGHKSPGTPTMTAFRRLVQTAFNNKRLSGVARVGFCEVSDAGGGIFDDKAPNFAKLSTALVVTAVGRFPRT